MSDSDSDPFRVTPAAPSPPPEAAPPPPPSAPSPSAPPPPAPPSPDQVTRRRALTLRLVLLAGAAAFTALLAPPVGVLLGVLALVAAVRATLVSPGVRVGAALVGGAALVLGLGVTAVAVAFRTELGTYNTCLQGANTRVAEQACRGDLDEALQQRLGFTF